MNTSSRFSLAIILVLFIQGKLCFGDTIELKPGETYIVPGTSYAEIEREEKKKKLAPYIIVGYLVIFLL